MKQAPFLLSSIKPRLTQFNVQVALKYFYYIIYRRNNLNALSIYFCAIGATFYYVLTHYMRTRTRASRAIWLTAIIFCGYYKLSSRERSGRAHFIFTINYIRNIFERDLSELVRSGAIFHRYSHTRTRIISTHDF